MMSVSVIPSYEPSVVSEGLCGNYNNDPNDDFNIKGTNIRDTGGASDGWGWSAEPVLMAASYL